MFQNTYYINAKNIYIFDDLVDENEYFRNYFDIPHAVSAYKTQSGKSVDFSSASAISVI